MNSTLFSVLAGFAPFIPFFFILLFLQRPKPCPDCGQQLPRFLSPLKKTKRHWIQGGCICTKCGCDVDTAGRKVTAGTALRLRPLATAIVMLTLLCGIGAVLVTFLLQR
ncbi:MAG: hypothetical protein FVQ85_06315 [Planctomycetes bacterium]|nr:hypothetical protein [Planctomycetota bacterium]